MRNRTIKLTSFSIFQPTSSTTLFVLHKLKRSSQGRFKNTFLTIFHQNQVTTLIMSLKRFLSLVISQFFPHVCQSQLPQHFFMNVLYSLNQISKIKLPIIPLFTLHNFILPQRYFRNQTMYYSKRSKTHRLLLQKPQTHQHCRQLLNPL